MEAENSQTVYNYLKNVQRHSPSYNTMDDVVIQNQLFIMTKC